jgi:hypothetical protein
MPDHARGALTAATAGYAGQDVPLRDHATMAAGFTVALAGALALGTSRGRELPERLPLRDVPVVGVATHKLSRTLSKGEVTGFARGALHAAGAAAGRGEVEEGARGEGVRRVVGELLVCPYCLGQWVAGAFTAGLVLAPRATRLLAGMFARHRGVGLPADRLPRGGRPGLRDPRGRRRGGRAVIPRPRREASGPPSEEMTTCHR